MLSLILLTFEPGRLAPIVHGSHSRRLCAVRLPDMFSLRAAELERTVQVLAERVRLLELELSCEAEAWAEGVFS